MTERARAGLVAVLGLGALSLGLLWLRAVPWDAAIGALVIIWLSALPGILYLCGVGRSPVPFLPAVGLYYFVFFGLPVFAAPFAYHIGDGVLVYYRILLSSPGFDVTLTVAAGLAIMISGFYGARFFLFARWGRFRLPDPEPRSGVLNLLYWGLMIGSLAYSYLPMLGHVPSVGQFFGPVSYLAFGGFYLQWRAGRLPRWQTALVVLVCVPLELYARTRVFFITDLLFMPMFFVFVLWRTGQLRIIAALLVAGICVAGSYSLVQPERNAATFSDRLASVVNYSVHLFSNDAIREDLSPKGHLYQFYPRISPLVNRVGQIWIFQTVYERTPDPVPYWMGETYRPLLTAYIPRLIYPDKPEERAGKAFGLRYGFTDAEGDPSSYNIPWIVELFANFGILGITLGMCAVGLFLAALDKVFNAPGMSDLEFLIGLVLIFRLAYPESNFSVMTGSMPVLFLALYLYFVFGTKALTALGDRLGRRAAR